MCKAPGQLADGTQIACRKCSLCTARIRNDWIGRCIAESKTAKACHVINLTYGRNKRGDVLHERSVILTYSDVQKFLKLLRRHGYPVRYFVTGEYGNEKGRAHWHIILLWQDKVPDFAGWDQYGEWVGSARNEQRFNWVRVDDDRRPVYDPKTGDPAYFWPHGFAYVQPVTQKTVQYVCYYVLKELDHEGRQYHCAQSKKPPLGMAYFEQLAERMVEAGIAPQTPEYKFPGVTRRKRTGGREAIPFWLKDRPLEMFLDHYIATWAARKGDKPRPRSELVDLYEEWGRVVSEEGATERAVAEWQAETKFHQRQANAKPRKKSERTKPANYDEWWWDYIEGAESGQEKQKREEQFLKWVNGEADAFDREFTVGFDGEDELLDLDAEGNSRRAKPDSGCNGECDKHGECKCEGKCCDTEIREQHDERYGPSKLDRLKTRFQAFHTKPDNPDR